MNLNDIQWQGKRFTVSDTADSLEAKPHRGKQGTVNDYIEPSSDVPVFCTKLDDGTRVDLEWHEIDFEGEHYFNACDMESIYAAGEWLVEEIERLGIPECGMIRITVEYIQEDE